MASQSSSELNERKSNDENDQNLIEETTNEDHIQRKRFRVGSHPGEDNDDKIDNDKKDETVDETLSTSVENHEIFDHKTRKNTTGSIKRRKLSVDIEEIIDQDEKTNDSVQMTTNGESKDESSTTTTDDDDDDDDDDDEDDNETKSEDSDEDDEEENNTNEQNNLLPTTNIYLRYRQRELGVFNRPKQRTTCRAFHNHIIASRNIVQRMKVLHTLDGHNGCVNALAFNRTGNLILF